MLAALLALGGAGPLAQAQPQPALAMLDEAPWRLPEAQALPSASPSASTSTAAPAPTDGALRELGAPTSALVAQALNFLGVPYRRGGDSASGGFDCSGFTRHVFEQTLGLALPRRAHEQATRAGLAAVRRDELRPGDLVFFNTLRRAFSHVGIYVGEGRFVHAPAAGGAVRVESLRLAYWSRRFNGARRAPETALATEPAYDATPVPGARH